MYLPRLPFTSRPPSPSPDIGCSPRPPRAADRRPRDPPCPKRHDGPAATPAGGGPMPWKPVSSSTPARHHSAAYRARGTWPAHCTTRDPWTGHCRRGCRTGTQLHSRLRGKICTCRQSGADSLAKRPRARRARARSSMDRATGFYPVGWGFESLRAHNVAGQEAARSWRSVACADVYTQTCTNQLPPGRPGPLQFAAALTGAGGARRRSLRRLDRRHARALGCCFRSRTPRRAT